MPTRTVLGACLVSLVVACGGNTPKSNDAQSGGGSVDSGGTGSSTAGKAASGGSGGEPTKAPPHIVSDCAKLGEVGVWENITPEAVNLAQYGVQKVTIDPHDSAVIYIGTDLSGLLRSNDCGATWTKVNTGTLGAELDKGAVGAVIDPIDSQVIYTSSLYGPNGLFKSLNGGVDWKQILTPEIVKAAPYGGFVGGISMDPNDHLHLLVSWHAVCAAPYSSACFAETRDGGTSWTMRNLNPEWEGGEGASLQFTDSTTWIFNSESNGMWRTTDEGKTWTEIPDVKVSHGAGQLYRVPDGGYFLGTATGVLSSPDGITWTLAPNSGKFVSGVVGDGETVWTSSAYPYGVAARPDPYLPYMQAKVSDPLNWTQFTSPMMTSGASKLAYDPDYKVLYSVNYWEGVWRVVVK